MKRYRFADLDAMWPAHVAGRLIPGQRLAQGGLSFHPPGVRTHDKPGPHVHADHEVLCILQGKGIIEIDGRKEPVAAGDVLVIEPGDDHHLVVDSDHPIVNIYFHANADGHPVQYPKN